ncbi:hypothetical protein HOU41_gp011 [Proteus phage Stubb]|uniref:Uncharacterized protein n=1 Tax=Proteus phage Stubb TaxID=2315597 RepID=A0A3B8DIY1_9CAUD|nr:hypothetical protein HOU41_gp011 [Proteus phage Stubb]AYJ73151.1 hypothetical protein CPT_Stubb_011 [Proteus phage Stubb]
MKRFLFPLALCLFSASAMSDTKPLNLTVCKATTSDSTQLANVYGINGAFVVETSFKGVYHKDVFIGEQSPYVFVGKNSMIVADTKRVDGYVNFEGAELTIISKNGNTTLHLKDCAETVL